MMVYLREAIDKRGGLENIQSLEELREAILEGAVHRLRPKLLTEGVAILAIFPMVFAQGVGAEVLASMALPVLGGLLISDEVVDLFLPVRFYWVRRARWLKLHPEKDHSRLIRQSVFGERRHPLMGVWAIRVITTGTMPISFSFQNSKGNSVDRFMITHIHR